MSVPLLARTVLPGGLPTGLADEPITPELVARVAGALEARADTLRARRVSSVATALGRVGVRFLDADDPLRARALALLPASAHVSGPMAEAILDGMARDWSADRLTRLVAEELGEAEALDRTVHRTGRRKLAVGPRLCTQIVSGSVPGVGVNALLRSLLVKAPTLLKPGRGDEVLSVLFAEGLREEDPQLADALAVVYWEGGAVEVESAALARAEVVVAYGSDETVAALRSLTPATARFIGYHHRVGVGIVGREALTAEHAPAVARDVATSVALFEQRGCVCPQLVLVESGGAVGPDRFAEQVAGALSELERALPGPELSVDEASRLQQMRATAEMKAETRRVATGDSAGRRAATGPAGADDEAVARLPTGGMAVYHGGADGGWTVLLRANDADDGLGAEGRSGGHARTGADRRSHADGWDGGVEPAGAGRTVRLRVVDDVADVYAALRPLGAHLQSVGYAGLGARTVEVAEGLGRLGASRVTPFARVAFPPPWWMHDGRGPLSDLVRWIEVEQE